MVTLAVTLVLLVVLVVVGAFVRVPYVSLGPGPTVNTLGAVGQTPVVKISGAPVRATDGNLNLTTVSVTDQLTLFQAIGMWFSGRDSLQPREEVFPRGRAPRRPVARISNRWAGRRTRPPSPRCAT